MGRRQRRRDRAVLGDLAPGDTSGDRTARRYEHPEHGALGVRDDVSANTLGAIRSLHQAPAASQEDLWQRRGEMLFERLVLWWEVAGLPLEGQKELLGRYRMADTSSRNWIRETLLAHVRERHPEVDL